MNFINENKIVHINLKVSLYRRVEKTGLCINECAYFFLHMLRIHLIYSSKNKVHIYLKGIPYHGEKSI